MAQKKLKRFNEIRTFQNVFENPENIKGKWHNVFKNTNPIILELACGKGEYTIGLSKIYPNKNFIGVDIKGNRIWAGAKLAIEHNYQNAVFLRTHIDKIENYFKKEEVSEIWITFPDPQLRTSRAKKRLTHPRYLKLYNNILPQGGTVHLKTDSPELYQFTKQVSDFFELPILVDYSDLYTLKDIEPELTIKTHYEGLDIAKSNKIFYLKFLLSDALKISEKQDAFCEYYKITCLSTNE